MSSPPPSLSSFLRGPAEADPRAGLPGHHLVIVPHVGDARCVRLESLGELAAVTSAAFADPDVMQVFAFGPDGRHYPTVADPPYLFAASGPLALRQPEAAPNLGDPCGYSPHASLSLKAVVVSVEEVPPTPTPALPGSMWELDLDIDSEFEDDGDS